MLPPCGLLWSKSKTHSTLVCLLLVRPDWLSSTTFILSLKRTRFTPSGLFWKERRKNGLLFVTALKIPIKFITHLKCQSFFSKKELRNKYSFVSVYVCAHACASTYVEARVQLGYHSCHCPHPFVFLLFGGTERSWVWRSSHSLGWPASKLLSLPSQCWERRPPSSAFKMYVLGIKLRFLCLQGDLSWLPYLSSSALEFW